MAIGLPPSPPHRLRFRKTLTKDPKLTTHELIKRLTTLQDELIAFEQDSVDRDSLTSIRDELIQPFLIVHKDKTVKALVACCIANLLRLYAPDAPYTLPELRDIFQFFFRQLRNLQVASTQSPNQTHYLHLMESLASVQSIVLVCDLPQSDELITEIFQDLFNVVSTEMSQNFMLLFAELLTQIINAAAPIVPMSVVKLLLDQFRPKQIKSNPAAHRLAVDICNACEDRLKQEVCRYFNDILNRATRIAGFDPDDTENSQDELSDDERETQKGFVELEAAHNLIKSIYQSCPGILQSVVPQLEVELRKSQVQLRLLAVQTLGQMLAEQPIGSTSITQALNSIASGTAGSSNHLTFHAYQPIGADFPRRYPSTWKEWLRKSYDVSPQIRVEIVHILKHIISRHPHLKSDINKVLKAKLVDPDEKVRCETCKLFQELEFELILHHIDTVVLKTLGGRIEDRKPSVQQEALRALGRLYNLAQSGIEANNSLFVTQVSWIPETFLSGMFAGDARLSCTVEKYFEEFITPFPSSTSEEVAWVDRLITVARYLDKISLKKLGKFSHVGIKQPTVFHRYLNACEVYNGGVVENTNTSISKQLAEIIRHIASQFPEPSKAKEDLHQIAKQNDKRLYKLLKTMSDEQVDLSNLIKSRQELRRKLKSSSYSATLEILVHKSAYLILNSSSIPTLLQRIQESNVLSSTLDQDETTLDFPHTIHQSARALLDLISINRPAMIKPHIDLIIECLLKVTDASTKETIIEGCLMCLSETTKTDPDFIPSDHRQLIKQLIHFAIKGTHMQAKLAVTVLAKSPQMKTSCCKVNDDLATSLTNVTARRLVGHLSGLSQIVKHSPDIFEKHGAAVTTFIVHNLIVKADEADQQHDEDWIADEELSDLNKARIEGLKLLTNRCIAFATLAEALAISAPVLKLLWQLMEGNGKIGPITHSPGVASRLRLRAAQSILKLASYQALSQNINSHFETLAWMSQDSCYWVRERFITKLVKYLQSRRLNNPRFNVILFLVPHDPEPEIIEIARTSIKSRKMVMAEHMKANAFEKIIVLLLHLLARTPDLTLELDDLKTFSKYVEFFIDCVGDNENISLLYHLSGKLKTVQDAQSAEPTEALYIMSELAQLVIKTKAQEHHWVLATYPGKDSLPTDIFRPLPPDEAHEVAKKVYLPEEFTKIFTSAKSLSKKARTGPGTVDAALSTEDLKSGLRLSKATSQSTVEKKRKR
ncbi:hypothetical protein O181_030746 [Austropuccinia psidii MF-1]|uniref:Sister chromatid cohesion protein n=1 Tax=Austropuccinia psidii MF-1 TaxID=1389203 RepID=A0A9Q3CZ34_9BASI|nr:hypothetical protein [Austropuccinia psidii MF-1]